jgi:hypothetical protein
VNLPEEAKNDLFLGLPGVDAVITIFKG